MSSEDSQAFADIALLFELSLGVSQSLDLQANCDRFLGRLMSRKNLAHTALWIRREELPPELLPDRPVPEGGLALVYRAPKRQELPLVLDRDHPAVVRAASEGPFSASPDPTPPAVGVAAAHSPTAVVAVFPLQDLGLLELGSLARSELFSARELAQLATVVSGFAVSVKGCLDHLRMVSEMTARKQLDEQLRHSQKMEAVGQLAGGVAHDFNNLLVGIVGATELLRRAQVSEADRCELADVILATAERAAGLTRQLLTFSRRDPPERQRLDMNRIVEDVVRLLGRTIDPRVQIEVTAQEVDAAVLGDASELKNALLNLGLNARDAMPEGGRLTFRVRPASVQELLESQLCDPPQADRYVAVDVLDTGSGMTAGVRRRAFEPFFTTKPFGRGTGLGLAAVYGIVQRHGGVISIDSAPGEGTRFTLLLKRATGPAEPAASAPRPDPVVSGHGLILVVDDEESVGEMCAMMLESLGYQALGANSGERGLELYGSRHEDIDLVILDMMMPGMNGVETLAALRAVDPAVPVVMCSGFGHSVDQERVRELGIAATLAKPFTLGQLSQVVSAVVAARPAGMADEERRRLPEQS